MPRGTTVVPPIVGNLKNAALLEQRRQELVRNAAAVFVEQRFDKTSVGDIAERCGWSIGSLYRYVSSKEDILVLVCDEIFRNLSIETLGEGAEDDPAARFASAFGGYLDNVYRNRREVLLMYREYTQLPREAQDYFRALESQLYDRLARIVSDGVKAGAFTCDAPRLFAIDCVMRAHTLALKEWALGRTSYKQLRKHLLAWSLGALSARAQ
jgi:AcrR family transcriptional regulator